MQYNSTALQANSKETKAELTLKFSCKICFKKG